MRRPYASLGHLLGNSELLRTTHNSFSNSSPFSISRDQDPDKEKEDAYHFIAYVPKMGCVWELDGLKTGAVRHGACEEGEAWVKKATEVIQERISTYPPGSVSAVKSRFCILLTATDMISLPSSCSICSQSDLLLYLDWNG
jgi:hypothetical protein